VKISKSTLQFLYWLSSCVLEIGMCITGAITRNKGSSTIVPFPVFALNKTDMCISHPQRHRECNGDEACNHDYWTTGNMPLAYRTLRMSSRYQQIQQDRHPGEVYISKLLGERFYFIYLFYVPFENVLLGMRRHDRSLKWYVKWHSWLKECSLWYFFVFFTKKWKSFFGAGYQDHSAVPSAQMF
jgi:hypothetical protein